MKDGDLYLIQLEHAMIEARKKRTILELHFTRPLKDMTEPLEPADFVLN